MKIDEIKKNLISRYHWIESDFSYVSDSSIYYFYSLGMARKTHLHPSCFLIYIDWFGLALSDIFELGFYDSVYFDWRKEGF